MNSLVIPVYKNEESLPTLLDQLDALADSLNGELELVFVVDGSPDNCLALLRQQLPTRRFKSVLCAHSRNFGSFAAIRTGLAEATGERVAVMAADLQEPPSMARDFFERLKQGDVDIVIGKRTGRADPLFSRLSSSLFWWAYRKLVLPEVTPGGVDVFGCTRKCRDVLLQLNERNSSLVGLLFWVGFQRAEVPYERLPRPHGRSAWTWSKKLRYLFDSIYSFSDLPIRLLTRLGVGSMVLAAVVGTVVLIARLVGSIPVPGYTPLILAVVFFGGLNAFGIGLLGDYVWRTFENTKGRPLAIVADRTQFPRSEK